MHGKSSGGYQDGSKADSAMCGKGRACGMGGGAMPAKGQPCGQSGGGVPASPGKPCHAPSSGGEHGQH